MIPTIDVGRIIEWGANRVVDALKWIAVKALIGVVLFYLLPKALLLSRIYILETILPWVLSQYNLPQTNQIMEFTGLVSWIALKLQLDYCFAVLMGAAVTKVIIRIYSSVTAAPF